MRGRKHPPKTRAPRASAAEPSWSLEHLPRPEAVRLLTVSDRTFTRLESEGIIRAKQAGSGGRHSVYSGPLIVAAYLTHERVRLTNSVESPRDARDRSQAELNQLRLARERGAVLPREQVVKEGQAYIRATMAKLRAIPSRLIRAGVIPRTSEPVLADLIREAQEEMARWQNTLDLERVVDAEKP